MSSIRRDPLLAGASWLALFFMALMVIIAVAMQIGILAIYLYPEQVAARMGERIALLEEIKPALALLLAGFFGFALIGFDFLRQIRRIVASVGAGDPFELGNARRLERMGWLLAGGQLLAIPLAAIARYLKAALAPGEFDIELGFSLETVLIVLLLFILARVFRAGAAMREDLEGTV